MTRNRRAWLALAALAGAAAFHINAARRRRDRRLERGKLRRLHSAWYSVNGLRIFARVGGDPGALPIVLVHGLGVSSAYFVPFAERLATRFCVYAPDLPGHGHSDTPAAPLGIAALSRALLDWMDVAQIPQAILLGHSMGAQVAVATALQASDRVPRLILVGLTPDPAARSTVRIVARFLFGGLFERPSLIPLLLKDYLHMGRRFAPEFHAMRTDPIEHKLPLVEAPSILARGQHDPIVPQAWTDTAAKLVRAEHVIVIPHWGHAVQYGAPDALFHALLPHLPASNAERLVTTS